MLMFLPLAWGKRTARYRLSCSTQRAESTSDTRLRTRSETHLASPHVPYSTYNLHYRAVNERRKKNKQLGHPRANAGQCTTVQPGCKLLYLTILTQRYTPTFRIYCALLYSPRPAYIQNHYIANIHRRAAHELSLLFPRRCTGYRDRAIICKWSLHACGVTHRRYRQFLLIAVLNLARTVLVMARHDRRLVR